MAVHPFSVHAESLDLSDMGLTSPKSIHYGVAILLDRELPELRLRHVLLDHEVDESTSFRIEEITGALPRTTPRESYLANWTRFVLRPEIFATNADVLRGIDHAAREFGHTAALLPGLSIEPTWKEFLSLVALQSPK